MSGRLRVLAIPAGQSPSDIVPWHLDMSHEIICPTIARRGATRDIGAGHRGVAREDSERVNCEHEKTHTAQGRRGNHAPGLTIRHPAARTGRTGREVAAPGAVWPAGQVCRRAIARSARNSCPPKIVERTRSRSSYSISTERSRRRRTSPHRKAPSGRRPTVLFNHSHGGGYKIGKAEFIDGREYMGKPPYAEFLTSLGYNALCFDAWIFGERSGRAELDMFKDTIWHGRVLWGMMVYDALKAVDYLVTPARCRYAKTRHGRHVDGQLHCPVGGRARCATQGRHRHLLPHGLAHAGGSRWPQGTWHLLLRAGPAQPLHRRRR